MGFEFAFAFKSTLQGVQYEYIPDLLRLKKKRMITVCRICYCVIKNVQFS